MLIIAPCSSKKLVTASLQLHAHSFSAKTLDGYVQQWVSRVSSEKNKYFPNDVYAGQGMAAARQATELLDGELCILSAGLSIVRATRRIPGYNLTVSNDGPNPLHNISESATSTDWWKSLNRAFGCEKPLAKLIKSCESKIIIALPSSYLLMVMDELASLSAAYRKKLRIITSVNMTLTQELSDVAIRYDQRLNVVKGAPHGANASFVQRALLHFSRIVQENSRIHTTASQQLLVNQALGKSITIQSPTRIRITDDAMVKVIESILRKKIIGRTSLLEVIRHDKNIACEQHRFSHLYDQVLTARK